jgi:Protein of unknown function (DUF2721)
MDFKLKDVLDAIGPTAALVFAAWIFLSFLQQRYVAAYDRYRLLIRDYREAQQAEQRRQNIKDQILLYKRRCQQMRIATNLGVIAALFLLLTLVLGAVNAMFPNLDFLKYPGAASAVIGLCLVIVSAVIVIMENTLIQHAIESELADIPDLAEAVGQYRAPRH